MNDPRELADFVARPQKGVAGSPRRWIIAHAGAWGLLLVALVVVVMQFERVFQDFGVDLPGMTILFIKVGHARVLLVPALLIVLGVDWSVLKAMQRRGDSRGYRAWGIAMLALPILLFATMIAALALPLVTIMTRLSG